MKDTALELFQFGKEMEDEEVEKFVDYILRKYTGDCDLFYNMDEIIPYLNSDDKLDLLDLQESKKNLITKKKPKLLKIAK